MPSLDAFHERFETLNGHDLAWLEWGPEEKLWPPLLCLHGVTGQSHVWDPVASRLMAGRLVIAPDLRGHGDSEHVSPPAYGPREHRADIEALLSRLAIGRYALMGQGFGAVLGAMLAGAYPTAVQRLVLVEPTARAGPGGGEAGPAAGDEGHALLQGYEALVQAARATAPRADDVTLTWLVPYLFRAAEGGHVPKWAPAARADPDRWDVLPWLARIRCAVLLVRGAESADLPPEAAEAMAAEIDDCRVVTVADAGHAVMVEQPQRLLEAVEPFLGRAG